MRSFAGFIVGLIGGILGIIGGIVNLIYYFIASQNPLLGSFLNMFGVGIIVMIMAIWGIIASGIIIFGSLMMNKQDNAKVKKGALITLILGIIAPINIIAIIGGIIGLVQAGKPAAGQPAQQTAKPAQKPPAQAAKPAMAAR